MYAPEGLAVMRWIFNSGEITVANVLGQNAPKILAVLFDETGQGS